MNKVKQVILIFLISNVLIHCSYTDRHHVINYKTDEFVKFEAAATIKLNEAWDIQKKYAFDKNKSPGTWLFFVIDDHYVFTTIFHPKIPDASTGGIWVHSETGEVKEVENNTFLRYTSAYNGDGAAFYF